MTQPRPIRTVKVPCPMCKKKTKVKVAIPLKSGKSNHPVECQLCRATFTTTIDWGNSHEIPDDLLP